jgi:hypothetical protein
MIQRHLRAGSALLGGGVAYAFRCRVHRHVSIPWDLEQRDSTLRKCHDARRSLLHPSSERLFAKDPAGWKRRRGVGAWAGFVRGWD